MNYKRILDVTAAAKPPQDPHTFSSLRNVNVSICNITKVFVIGLTSAKFRATGLTSHSFVLSHCCLTRGIVFNRTKWTFIVPFLAFCSFESKDFHVVGLRTPSTARAGSKSGSVWMTFSFFMSVGSQMCFLAIGLPAFTAWERGNK